MSDNKGGQTHREIEIGALDTETGGLNPQENGLISVAIVPPKHLKELKPLHILLEYDQDLKYEHKALEVNGFYPIQDRDTGEFFWWQTDKNGKRRCVKGTKEEEALETILTYLEVYLKDAFIAGCNISFDKSFLIEACKRADAKRKVPSTDKSSFQRRLDKCLLRKTLELQTLALCAHIQNQITLPYTYKTYESKAPEPNDAVSNPKGKSKGAGKKPPEEKQTQPTKRKPSLSLNSIAQAISELQASQEQKENAPKLSRTNDQHDALEDAILTLELTQILTKPWSLNLKKQKEDKGKVTIEENNDISQN